MNALDKDQDNFFSDNEEEEEADAFEGNDDIGKGMWFYDVYVLCILYIFCTFDIYLYIFILCFVLCILFSVYVLCVYASMIVYIPVW